jgi:hypothetical protein
MHQLYIDVENVLYLQSRNKRVARRRRMVVAETPTRRKSRGNLSGRDGDYGRIIGNELHDDLTFHLQSDAEFCTSTAVGHGAPVVTKVFT